MPYISKEKREAMDEIVDAMNWYEAEPDGRLNYVLFKYCKNRYYDKGLDSYNGYKNFIGELNKCVAEIRRRLLAPYEDKKLIENGDVI